MTAMEERGLVRGGILLLLLALARFGVSGIGDPPAVVGPGGNQLEALLEEAGEEAATKEAASRPLAPGETVDPNRGAKADLQRLPGVGPSLAETLIRIRETRGGFEAAEDLLDVTGIGPATLERIRPHLDFSRGVPLELRKTRRSLSPSSPLDLNRATREELEGLPGIGPALASRILESRTQEGPFLAPEDLTRVSGIGPATLRRLRGLVTVRR